MEQELFDRVQAVFALRGATHSRKREHVHYLKGTLWCYECRQRGHEYRLIRQRPKGNGGTNDYYFCRGRQEGVCRSRHIGVELAEPAVVDFYSRIEFPPEFVGLVRSMVAEVLNDADLTQRLRGRQLVKERADLEKKEANLIELAADGELSSAKVRVRIREI